MIMSAEALQVDLINFLLNEMRSGRVIFKGILTPRRDHRKHEEIGEQRVNFVLLKIINRRLQRATKFIQEFTFQVMQNVSVSVVIRARFDFILPLTVLQYRTWESSHLLRYKLKLIFYRSETHHTLCSMLNHTMKLTYPLPCKKQVLLILEAI